MQASARFDAQLIMLGNWTAEERDLFNIWLDQDDLNNRYEQAGDIIIHFVVKILGNDLSHEASGKLNHLKNIVSNLEQLVFTTRGLTNKFYRDHLNHMIKVGLLANALAIQAKIPFTKFEMDLLVLASFLHDVAYPLSDSVKMHRATIKALKNSYFSAEYYDNEFNTKLVVDVNLLSSTIGMTEYIISKMIEDMNHGVFSSIEFMKYLKDEDSVRKYSSVIKTIAIHDSAFTTEVDLNEDPISSLLILSDELQDWGRPSIVSDFIIPRINNFDLSEGTLSGVNPIYDNRNYSVLKQLSGKMKNLKRLKIDSNIIKLDIRFKLYNLNKIDINNFSVMLEQLFESNEENDLLNPMKNNAFLSVSDYERKLYGLSVDIINKNKIYELMKSNKLSSDSPFSPYDFYMNEYGNELICSDINILGLNEIILSNNDSDDILLNIYKNEQKLNINLENIHDGNQVMFEYLIYEMRMINYMIYLISDVFKNLPPEALKIEGLCNDEILEKLKHTKKGVELYDSFVKLKITNIISCIKNNLCFILKKDGIST